jgi:hypothetical protein
MQCGENGDDFEEAMHSLQKQLSGMSSEGASPSGRKGSRRVRQEPFIIGKCCAPVCINCQPTLSHRQRHDSC